MVKIRVHDADGVLRGGLLKLWTLNRLEMRAWDGPPHPHYQETLWEMAPGEWLLVRLATGWSERFTPEDDQFDADSRATWLRPEDVLLWFKKQSIQPPKDLCIEEGSDAANAAKQYQEGQDSLRLIGVRCAGRIQTNPDEWRPAAAWLLGLNVDEVLGDASVSTKIWGPTCRRLSAGWTAAASHLRKQGFRRAGFGMQDARRIVLLAADGPTSL